MSEALTPTAANTGVPEPGSASVTPPVADTTAPAASSSPPELVVTPEPAAEAPAAEPAEKPASILSEATAEPLAEPEKPVEPEAKAEETKPAEPLPPPTYEAFKLPEGVTLAEDKLGEFTGVLGEFEQKVAADPAQAHAAAQEFGQKLLDLYVSESRAAADRYTQLQQETWQRTIEQWKADFRADPELGRNRRETTLKQMGGLMDLYGQTVGPDKLQAVRDVFTMTGAGDHPEVLRFVNWAASRLTETARPVVPMMPRAPVPGASRAARLYKNTNGAA